MGWRARPEAIERHEAEDKRASVWNEVAVAAQWVADLVATREQPELAERAYRVLDKLFYCVPQALAASSQYHRIALFVLEDGGEVEGVLRIAREFGFESESYARDLRLPVKSSIAGLVYTTGRSYRTGDVLKDENWLKVEGDAQQYRSLMCAPVIAADQTLGVLSVDSTEAHAFTEEDELSLGIFGRHVAVLLTMARQEQAPAKGEERE